MNKLEKVALRYTLKMGRPIVLVFNSMYLRRSLPWSVMAKRFLYGRRLASVAK